MFDLAILMSNAMRRDPPAIIPDHPQRAVSARNSCCATGRPVAPQRRASRSRRPALRSFSRPRPAIFLRLFRTAGHGPREAQLCKERHVAAKLLAEPGQRVLDISLRLGGMALYLARHCRRGRHRHPLLEEQIAIARAPAPRKRLFRPRPLPDRGLSRHGRDIRSRRVGRYSRACRLAHSRPISRRSPASLNEDGVALIHDRPRRRSGRDKLWISNAIFPGGSLPVGKMSAAVRRPANSPTSVLHAYAENAESVAQRTFHAPVTRPWSTTNIRRMWEFCLSVCELTFRWKAKFGYAAPARSPCPITRACYRRARGAVRVRDVSTCSVRLAAARRITGQPFLAVERRSVNCGSTTRGSGISGPLVWTRRFCARSPAWTIFRRHSEIARVRMSATLCARQSVSDRLSTGLPTASVWPSTRKTSLGLFHGFVDGAGQRRELARLPRFDHP